jgi:perosamine synthetase
MDFFFTHVSGNAISNAKEVLESGFLSEGAWTKRFEAALQDVMGLANPVALNSGTSALHLALAAGKVGPGDEVILPAQTFVASGLAVLMQGATPVFADIDPKTGNLSPASAREKVTGRTKAVMPVHWGGYPCDLEEIGALANEFGIFVIEDAAHAFGAEYRGRAIGAISRFTAFSFQAIKHVTSGDGGALSCVSDRDSEHLKILRWFGIDRANSQTDVLGERRYDISELGYKYHMNNLAAAIGLGNLDTFPERLARRRALGAGYRRELAGVAGIELLDAAADRTHAYWLFTMLVERREEFILKLAARGVPASVVHRRIDRNSIFGGVRDDLAGQDSFDRRQVSIPVHEGLSDADVESIVRTIREGW